MLTITFVEIDGQTYRVARYGPLGIPEVEVRIRNAPTVTRDPRSYWRTIKASGRVGRRAIAAAQAAE